MPSPQIKHPQIICPSCESTNHERRGYKANKVFNFIIRWYKCSNCGQIFRTKENKE